MCQFEYVYCKYGFNDDNEVIDYLVGWLVDCLLGCLWFFVSL